MSNRTVLLIDYDPGSIDSATRPLEEAGFHVEVAHDGLAGLEAFEKLRPDLVLIEPMVPKKHGFEVCQEIKGTDHGRTTPVLITTGFYRGRKHHLEAKQYYGCDEYLEKPISEEDLLATCRRLLPEVSEEAELADLLDSPRTGITSEPELPELQDLSEEEIVARLDALISEEPLVGPAPAAEAGSVAEAGPVPEAEPATPSPDADEPEVVFESAADTQAGLMAAQALVREPATSEPTDSFPDPVPDSPEPPAPATPEIEIVTARSEAKAKSKAKAAPVVAEPAAAGSRKRLLLGGLAAAALIVVAATGFVLVRVLGDGDAVVTPAPARSDEVASLATRPSPPAIQDPTLIAPPAPAKIDSALSAAVADPSAPPSGTDTASNAAGREAAPPASQSKPQVAKLPAAKPPRPSRRATGAASKPAEKPPTPAATRKPTPDPVVGQRAAGGSAAAAAVVPQSSAPKPATQSPAPVQAGEAAPPPQVAPATQSEPPVEPARKPARLATQRGTLVDLSEVDSAPVPRSKPAPEYPAAAQQMRLSGAVTLRLLVDENGNVAQTEILPGSAGGVLAKAAVRSAKGWTYSPGMKDGVPIRVWVTERVTFQR